MRRAVAVLAPLIGGSVVCVAHPAAADESLPVEAVGTSPTLFGDVEARMVWVTRPPPVKLVTPGKGGVTIQGLPGDFMPRSGTMYAGTVHVSVLGARWARPFVFPLLGLTLGAGSGGYANEGTSGAAVFDRQSGYFFGTVELPGAGVMVEDARLRGFAMLVPGIDFVSQSGQLHDASVHFDAEAHGIAFALRFELRGCAKAPDRTWWCGAVGPTLLEGTTLLNGGFFSAGAMF